MRPVIAAPLLALLLLGATACGGDDSPGPARTAENTEVADGAVGDTVPPCPFTAEQVTDILGQPMTDEGSCLFGDGKGVASLTVTTASELAGSSTYDFSREQADSTYDEVADLDVDGQGYVAVKDLGGEAVVVTPAGSYTMILSSFSALDPGGYDQVLRTLVDHVQGFQ